MEQIDNIDRRVLLELTKNARIPEVKLARLIGKSKESVRYRIKQLIEKKIIIGFTTWTDPIKLGFQTGKIYLNLANVPEKKKRFLEYLKKDKRLFWLGVAEGAWNIGLTYFIKSNEEFFNLKNELLSKFKDLIIECKTASVVGVYYHDKTFLHNSKTQWDVMFNSHENIELDKESIEILKFLIKNSRENLATISIETDISVDKIRNRIKKLNEQGIIKRYTIDIDYKKLGYEFYKTFIYFKDINNEELSNLMDYCLKNPNIIHLVKQISPWDIELEIMCESYHKYNEIISDLTAKFSKIIQKTETAIMGEDYVFPSQKLIFEE